MNQENKETISKAPSGRVKRTPVSGKHILTVQGKDPDKVYRIVNDEADRIARFQEGGYELVPDEAVKVGDNRVSKTSSEGTVKQVSVGGGRKAFVMAIKREWYEEDQKAKQQLVDDQESTIRHKALDGTYGKVELPRFGEKGNR